eukprot:GCRY01006051.1.p1 GENE.GCRY01006051.1~~GCRY01006051.1.p1  ORF type:complete len:670 (-),score=162.87 GCRY01006051.1:67-2076(-)
MSSSKSDQSLGRVYWPFSLNKSSGYIIGWNVKGFVVSVATVVEDQKLEDVMEALYYFAEDKANANLIKEANGAPIVLGEWKNGAAFNLHDSVEDTRKHANIWLSMSKNCEQYFDRSKVLSFERGLLKDTEDCNKIVCCPQVDEVYCCGYRYKPDVHHIIFYNLSARDKYLSLEPLDLDTTHSSNVFSEKKKKKKDLELALAQINASHFINDWLRVYFAAKKSGMDVETIKVRENPSVGTAPKAIKVVVLYILLLLRIIIDPLHLLLNYPIPGGPYFPSQKITCLGNTSLAAALLNRRLADFAILPQYLQEVNTRYNTHYGRSRLVNARNQIFSMLIDVGVGVMCGAALFFLRHTLTTAIAASFAFLQTELQVNVEWLMGWPAGFKLNENLAVFLGNVFLTAIHFWGYICQPLLNCTPYLLTTIALSGVLGVSVLVALLDDLFSVFCMHIYFLYQVAAFLYRSKLNVLVSLFHLFRGKKRNILRTRIDSKHYDLDQTLVGTLLFTIVFFLIPTTAVYYILMSLSRLCVLAVHALAYFFGTLWTHFPVYALYSRLTDPTFIPGGIQMNILQPETEFLDGELNGPMECSRSTNPNLPVAYLLMHSQGPATRSLFGRYLSLTHRLQTHYSVAKLIGMGFKGQHIPSLNLYYKEYPPLPDLSSFHQFLLKQFHL